jgi:hypothetical protein
MQGVERAMTEAKITERKMRDLGRQMEEMFNIKADAANTVTTLSLKEALDEMHQAVDGAVTVWHPKKRCYRLGVIPCVRVL